MRRVMVKVMEGAAKELAGAISEVAHKNVMAAAGGTRRDRSGAINPRRAASIRYASMAAFWIP